MSTPTRQMDVALLRRFVRAGKGTASVLRRAVDRQGLSARAYHRVLKVARTIADLAGAREVEGEHALEALQLRARDPHDAG